MARSLNKVQKQISKKRGGRPNALHENSRDAQRLRRAGAREDKLTKLFDAASKANQVYVNRIDWFKSALAGSEGALSEEETHVLAQSFVGRHDEELAELKSQRRPGRPKSKNEEQLQDRIDTEDREYRSGLWIPDLREIDGRDRLERWSGDWAGLNNLKFIRVTKDGVVKSSNFPPKGLS